MEHNIPTGDLDAMESLSLILPTAATSYYRPLLQSQIMAVRQGSLMERYHTGVNNPRAFELTWREDPRKIKVSKGPQCLQETESLEDIEGIE
jgi:hypothetical protein